MPTPSLQIFVFNRAVDAFVKVCFAVVKVWGRWVRGSRSGRVSWSALVDRSSVGAQNHRFSVGWKLKGSWKYCVCKHARERK